MANPNIYGATSIVGNNSLTSLTATTATSIVSNAASSSKIFKMNRLVVTNVDTSTPYLITINIYSAAALGGTAYATVSTLSVPAGAALVVMDKTNGIYLKEDQSIGATAGTANKFIVTASWDEIS
jgi:hypothetical protein